MNTKSLMTLSAMILALIGISLIFLPNEILDYLQLSVSETLQLLMKTDELDFFIKAIRDIQSVFLNYYFLLFTKNKIEKTKFIPVLMRFGAVDGDIPIAISYTPITPNSAQKTADTIPKFERFSPAHIGRVQ